VRPGDAAALLALQQEHQRGVLGRPDSTLDDVRDQLADPDLDPASAIVLDDQQRALGCAMVFADGAGDHVDIDVVVDPGRSAPFLDELLAGALDLAVAAAGSRGHLQVCADQGCYRQDTALASALARQGFAPATAFHRMRRDLDGPVEVQVPDAVAVERVDDPSEQALRRAHRLHTSTFAGHFGFVARPWEEWLAAHRARSDSGPLWFATLDGVEAGFLHETSQFEQDEDAGYVWRLGVEPAARGRGVARALLLSSFAAMRERGRAAALLHVDTANATGATALYESVGMRPVVVIDVWRCRRSVG
jgi:ribosomal protein S18 acetylase RimI-like enzyme